MRYAFGVFATVAVALGIVAMSASDAVPGEAPVVVERAPLVRVQAQGAPQQCGPYAVFAAHLDDKYGESPIIGGTMEGGAELVWWINADTQTWTVLIIQGEGACIRAFGTGIDLSPAQPQPGEGA